jgi:hypothetical protein
MSGINMGVILNVILAGLGLALVMAAVGMGLWYIKVKPDVDSIKNDLAKKAAAAEVVRINLDLEQKKTESVRIERQIEEKQDRGDCELLRKACQPLLLSQLENLGDKIDDLREGQKYFQGKLEKWMEKNGG